MISLEVLYDSIKNLDIDNKWINQIAKNIFEDNNHRIAKILIIFSTDEKLKNLKKSFFNQNVFTDVITFNLEDKNEPIDGEIYISIARVLENASIYKQDFILELKRVIIHGLLHLVGYDDQTNSQKKEMNDLENNYLNLNII